MRKHALTRPTLKIYIVWVGNTRYARFSRKRAAWQYVHELMSIDHSLITRPIIQTVNIQEVTS